MADLSSAIQQNFTNETRKIIAIRGQCGVDSEYERRRAIRRQTEGRFRRTWYQGHNRESHCVHGLIRRTLQKLSTRRWEEFYVTWKVWNILGASQRHVTQTQPFFSLAPSRGSSEIINAGKLCTALAFSRASSSSTECKLSTERIFQAYAEHCSFDPQIDWVFIMQAHGSAPCYSEPHIAPLQSYYSCSWF